MSTQGRRRSTRRRATESGGASALAPVETTIERAAPLAATGAAPDEPAVELLDDHAISIAGPTSARLARSLTGAIAGTMLVVGLAFGAAMGPGGALGPNGERGGDGAADQGVAAAAADGGAGHEGAKSAWTEYPDGDDGSKDDEGWGGAGDEDGDKPDGSEGGSDPTAKPDAGEGGEEPTDKPAGAGEPDPTKAPEPDPTKKPEPDRTPKPTAKPEPTDEPVDPAAPINLALAIKELHPILEWGSCDGLDFDYYKVVRSTNSTATWPAGDGDEVIAAVERGGYRKAYDKHAPHGVKAWYRVFCVEKTDAGYQVVTSSATKGIEVPEEPTPPDPIDLALFAEVNGEGKVVLDWSACEVDGFAFYKVVRSTWNDDPSYLPWTDGSEVIAVIEGSAVTEWLDLAPESGETTWYRVQCIGYSDAGKVLLGQTAAVAVTAD